MESEIFDRNIGVCCLLYGFDECQLAESAARQRQTSQLVFCKYLKRGESGGRFGGHVIALCLLSC